MIVLRRRSVQIVREDERGAYLSAPLELAQFIQGLEFVENWREAYSEVKRFIVSKGVGQHEVELRVLVVNCAPALEACVNGDCKVVASRTPAEAKSSR